MRKSVLKKIIVTLLIVTMLLGTAPAYALGTIDNQNLNNGIKTNDDIGNSTGDKPNENTDLPKEPAADDTSSNQSILEQIKSNHEKYIKDTEAEYKEIVAQLEDLNKKKASDEKNEDLDKEILYLEELKNYIEELIETEDAIYSDLENKLTGKITNPSVNELEQKYTDKIKSVTNAIELLEIKKADSTNQSGIEDRIKVLKQLKYNLGYEFNYIYYIDDVEDDNEDKISEIGYGLILTTSPSDEDLANLDKNIELPYSPIDYKIYPSNGYCLDYEFDGELKIADLNAYDSFTVLEGIYCEHYGENDQAEYNDNMYYDEFYDENNSMYGYHQDNGYEYNDDFTYNDYWEDNHFNNDGFEFNGQQPFYYYDDSMYGYYPYEDYNPNDYDYYDDETLSSDGYFDDAVNSVFEYYENLTWELETQIDDIEEEVSDTEKKIAELEKELDTTTTDEKKSLIENKISLYNEKIVSLTKIECLLMEQCNNCYEDLAAVLDIMFNNTDEVENQTDVINGNDSNDILPDESESTDVISSEENKKATDKENNKDVTDTTLPENSDNSVNTEPKDKTTSEEKGNDKNQKTEKNVTKEDHNNSNISWYEGYKEKINLKVEKLINL